MKKKRLFFLAIILGLSFLLLVSLTSAQEPKKEKQRIKAKLELTPEQKDRIMETRLNFQKDKIKLRADLKIAQLELKSLMREEELNKAEIYRQIEFIGDLKTQMAKNRVDQRMAIRDILTKEQLDKLKERKLKRAFGKRLMQHRRQHQKSFRPGRHFLERGRYQGGMGMLPSEAEPAPLMGAEEFFFEPAELAEEAELVRIFDEPELAEPAHLMDEIDLLPLLEEEFPPLPEEPEIAP